MGLLKYFRKLRLKSKREQMLASTTYHYHGDADPEEVRKFVGKILTGEIKTIPIGEERKK